MKQGISILLAIVAGVTMAAAAVHFGGRWGGMGLMVLILLTLLFRPTPTLIPRATMRSSSTTASSWPHR